MVKAIWVKTGSCYKDATIQEPINTPSLVRKNIPTMKARTWATILLEENKTPMSTERQHTHARAHTHNNNKKNKQNKRKVFPWYSRCYTIGMIWTYLVLFSLQKIKITPADSTLVSRWTWTMKQHLSAFIRSPPLDSHSAHRVGGGRRATLLRHKHAPRSGCSQNIFTYKHELQKGKNWEM